MEVLDQLQSDTLNTINTLFFKIGEGLISFIYAILVLVIGWAISKGLIFILRKALAVSSIDKVGEKINESDLFGKSEYKINISEIIIGFVRWILILVFMIIAADVMQWTIISVEISNLLRYLPKLFSALALFMIGVYIANFVRKAISGLFTSLSMSGGKVISSMAFYGIAILVTITALNQAGVDTTIITNNVTIILGAFLLTFVLAFGLGSKDVITNLLLTFYARKNYTVGEYIKVNGQEGEIVAIENISMTLKTVTGKVIIPILQIVENTVEVKE
ncbi:mechanosensitive ion channel family protein [Flavobacterium sp. 7A]|uniref:mechanosensitive ion channel family protein n=1 Tax=Flavobacterium sp. 7A TaxID=2940571 RepID=UPI002227B3FB|nr:mechanosensitive ion channel domain-containing protein [Flavobacterium sp. 7A]MCW2119105.1 hypothetical protein [Flavobacterium sp. 7A]